MVSHASPILMTFPLLTDNNRLEVLRALVGHIPPNPLWAELIWQRQDELKKQAAVEQPPRPALPARNLGHPLPKNQQR
jgi:hypothetical protein